MTQPYKINVPEEKISKLKQKLALAEFPTEIEDAGWTMGPPVAEVKRLVQYWKDGYDWRAAEAKLNELPHFITPITVAGFEPLNIHYIHVKSGIPGAIPLCFVHGWPGSFLEATKLIPLLTNPTNGPAFDVVVPSLPGYGFSEATLQPNFILERYGDVCHEVMLSLGYEEYVTQGGDWGFSITRLMALKYGGKHIKGTHLNNVLAIKRPEFTSQPLLWLQNKLHKTTDEEKANIARGNWFAAEGRGYNLLQSTKPLKLGYGLVDSPVALLTWILDKLHDWTDSYPWTDDEILTWISIYAYSTAGPEASVRIYYYSMHQPEKNEQVLRYNATPIGVSYFPQDLMVPPPLWAHVLGNIVFSKVHKSGGHFGAWERPHEVAEDLATMFGKGGGAYKVVKHKSGYVRSSKL